jgi:hypothetical protein
LVCTTYFWNNLHQKIEKSNNVKDFFGGLGDKKTKGPKFNLLYNYDSCVVYFVFILLH